MSCLDVMYHQNYGAHHYLPATPAAAAAYKAAYYHHHHRQHLTESKMRREEEQGEVAEARCKETQPAEAEYLSSRCVLFTYFHGDIGDVVDEHFSRALSQPSAFTNDPKGNRISSGALWKDVGSLPEGQCSSLPCSLWSSSYPSQTSPCVSTGHSDFSHTAAFHTADTGVWSGPSLAQPGLPPPSALPDSWPYSLGSQGGAGYPHVHEMYPHMHPRQPHPHTHAMLHHTHSATLDPRFNPLLLPSMRPSCSPSASAEGVKTELEPSGCAAPSWPAAFHGTVDIYDTGKRKRSRDSFNLIISSDIPLLQPSC
uniref:Vestigial-like family member 3 n=1 Tax=Electrophorus electricus TaxID=8005 RepID=A0A4W4EJ81_ELEEL